MLLFVSGVLSPITRELSDNTGVYLASVIGMNASVLPNEINTLSAQLLERDNELTQREIAINLKEAKQETGDVVTFVMSILLFILLVLMILNYVLDFVRHKKLRQVTMQHEKTA
jgi:hypothetical protein